MKYRLIKQKPHCCVPRCLQMIFARYGLNYDSQEDIGKELGLVNNKDSSFNCGTHIYEDRYSISNYFYRHNIPLSFEYHYITDISVVNEFLISNKDNDIIACYKRGVMFNKIMDGGHATLIEDYKNGVVKLVYPEDEKGYRYVKLEDLILAIKSHDKKQMAGFWLIKK